MGFRTRSLLFSLASVAILAMGCGAKSGFEAAVLALPVEDPEDPPPVSPITISSPAQNDILSSLTANFTGTCDSSASLTVTPGSSDITVLSSSCVAGVLSIHVQFKAGTGTRTLTAALSGAVTGTVTRTFQLDRGCPSGFVGVPGDVSLGTSDFCVSKYEIKDAGSLVAVSQAAGVPWASITRADASAACVANSWTLISNSEWQTIARNIEAVPANWSGQVVGTGMINRGFSDNVVDGVVCSAPPCAADSDDANGYSGTGNSLVDGWGLGAEQLRTHVLSNGEVIWDLSGNVAEWVAQIIGWDFTPTPVLSALGDIEYTDATTCAGSPCFEEGSVNRSAFAPLGNFSSTHGIGLLAAGSGAYGTGIIRGGHRNSGTVAGLFSADLTTAPTLVNAKVGFRCVSGF